MTKGQTTELIFSLEKETPGAVRYMEVDDQGNPRKQSESFIKTIYLRKDKLEGGRIPGRLVVSITIP